MRPHSPRLSPWLFLVVCLNVALAFGPGHGGDIGYWKDWIDQLQTRGFSELQANYPPTYMHWLWLMGQAYKALAILPESNNLLRLLANTPVMLTHLALCAFMARGLSRSDASPARWQAVMAFTALNPMLLLDGPLWGQVDLLFCLLLIPALQALISGRYLITVMPLLALAILTKFQTICIAPVLLALFWHQRHSRRLWLGLIPAALASLLLLAPYLLAGSTWSMIDQTYLKASSLYPLATVHATNLWYLLDLNMRPDSLFLPDPRTSAQGLMHLFTPKLVGIGLFGLLCLGVLVDSLRHRASERLWRNAILSATGFFLLLPGMHERYLVPAAIIALAALARHWRLWPHALCLTLLSALNIALILRPAQGAFPYVIAAVSVLFGIWALLCENTWARTLTNKAMRLPVPAWASAAVLVWLLPIIWQINQFRPDAEGWIEAQRLPLIETRQDWGRLRIDRTVEGGALTLAGKRFPTGFGTHAESRIVLPVPQDAETFEVWAGLDSKGGSAGRVSFSIRVDGKKVWESGEQLASMPPLQARIPLTNARRVELLVHSLGSNFKDHANWVQPRFRVIRR